MLGYENSTHTVLRFRRKLDTCDTAHDIPITVSSIYEIPANHPSWVTISKNTKEKENGEKSSSSFLKFIIMP